MTNKYHALILSDLHLGSPICQSELILKTLYSYEYDKLIINGDLLDSYHLHRLCKKQWKILSELRKISKTKECIFIVGNHDENCEVISILLGFNFVKEYTEKIGNKHIHFTHGDNFDTFIKNQPLITELASGIYFYLQKIDKNQKYTRKIKKLIKTWKNASDVLAKKACIWANQKKYNAIVLGHTHIAKHETIDNIEYVNLGSQCDLPVTHALINTDGEIELKHLDH